MKHGLARVLAGAVLAAGAAAACGQALTDPTRPPAAVASPGAQEPAAPGNQLQSILISKGRRLAVIDGNTVPLGGKVGEARITRITETEVVLKKGGETEVLKLYPAVEKKPVRRRAPVAGAAGQGGSR